jgi:hypothetical protein
MVLQGDNLPPKGRSAMSADANKIVFCSLLSVRDLLDTVVFRGVSAKCNAFKVRDAHPLAL